MPATMQQRKTSHCPAMIGTINLDYRSLVHHFENGVWMYDCESIAALKNDMEETLRQCCNLRMV